MKFKNLETISHELSHYILDAHISDLFIINLAIAFNVSPNTVKNLYKRKTRINESRSDYKTQILIIESLTKEAIRLHNELKSKSTEALEFLKNEV